jgi:hypothetical protein
MGSTSVDNPAIPAAMTFFFATNGKLFVPKLSIATFFFATNGKLFVPKLSIVPFVIQANVECLAYSSIYFFKHPSSSVGCEFINGVLNMGGFGEGGATCNDAAP